MRSPRKGGPKGWSQQRVAPAICPPHPVAPGNCWWTMAMGKGQPSSLVEWCPNYGRRQCWTISTWCLVLSCHRQIRNHHYGIEQHHTKHPSTVLVWKTRAPQFSRNPFELVSKVSPDWNNEKSNFLQITTNPKCSMGDTEFSMFLGRKLSLDIARSKSEGSKPTKKD